MNQKTLLKMSNVSVRYGGIKALQSVSLEIKESEIIAFMGPNGAGKSTVLKAVFGLAPIESGEIFWKGELLQPKPYNAARLGIAFVPQGRRVFSGLTVYENLEISGLVITEKKERKVRLKECLTFFPVLRRKIKIKAGLLSGGEQQMLSLARGLMAKPKLLLLDEPSLGLAPKAIKEIFAKIQEINSINKTAIVAVEHNIKSLLEIAGRGYVFKEGRIFFEGTSQAIRESAAVEKVFLS